MRKADQIQFNKIFGVLVEDLKNLGVYHSSFERVISQYVELQINIEKLKKHCEKNKINLYADVSEEACILSKRLESMEKELQLLGDRLCLSPKTYKTNIRKDGHRSSDISTHAPNNTVRSVIRLVDR